MALRKKEKGVRHSGHLLPEILIKANEL